MKAANTTSELSKEERIEKIKKEAGIPKEYESIDKNELAEIEKSMYQLHKKSGGFRKRAFNDQEELLGYVNEYIDICHEIGIYPTENGLIMYLGVGSSYYYAMLQAGGWQSEIFEYFRRYVSEVLNQAGLSGQTNTRFSIYYLKSKMQEYDVPTNFTVNVNNVLNNKNIEDMTNILNNTPIDVDYKEIK